MLDFPLLWIFTSAYYYSSMEDKYPTFYVNSSYLITTLQFTDTND